MGGRGIGNLLEETFINPLADLLFELDAGQKDTIVINEITKDGNSWKLNGYKLV